MQRRSRRTLTAAAAGLGALGMLGAVGTRARQRPAELRGQVAVVTGASRGLGLLLARQLADQGCRLVICARDQDELTRARADLERCGTEVLAVRCDISDRAQAEDLIERAIEHFGSVDVLVNNAGIIQVGPLEMMTVADFETAMGVMFWGTVYATLAALPHMRSRRSGRIVNITSIGGKVSVPHLVPYSCAKFAAVAFSEGLRAELTPEGIGVTTAVPGLMRTGSHLHALFTGQAEREFAWFSLAASVPLLSMDAERAARRIIDAAQRGRAEVILTPQAYLAAWANGALPGTTGRLLAMVNRLLPSGRGTDGGGTEGIAVQERMDSALFRGVTALNRQAARRFNQFPDSPPVG
jgi:short-subunit dehydrogenase